MSLINREDLMLTLGITDMDCEKCRWYSRAARRCKRGSDFEDACCAIDDAPKVKSEPKWIPVSERLPEENGEYLVTREARGIYKYVDIVKKTNTSGDIASDIVAWMPLPEPYREEGGEQCQQ